MRTLVNRVFKRIGRRSDEPQQHAMTLLLSEFRHELEILRLRLACYDTDTFRAKLMPVYGAVWRDLQAQLGRERAIAVFRTLMDRSTQAAIRRIGAILPAGRPDTDFRRYRESYTYAVATTLAVECWRTHIESDAPKDPEEVARQLLPEVGFYQLWEQPMVWADWLGFFRRAELGGLYANAYPETVGSERSQRRVKRKAIPVSQNPNGFVPELIRLLRDLIDVGEVSFNKAGDHVQVDAQGRLWIDPQCLMWPAEKLETGLTHRQVSNRMARLKVLRRTDKGKNLFPGRSRDADNWRVGYVIESQELLWDDPLPPGRFSIKGITEH